MLSFIEQTCVTVFSEQIKVFLRLIDMERALFNVFIVNGFLGLALKLKFVLRCI
jgi:hypothetical protein